MTNASFENAVLPFFEATRGDWLAVARATARELGSSGAIVTIDMVRDKCPPPVDVDPRVMGAVFTRREWQRVGYANSSRAACHHRPVALMKRKDT